MDPITALYGDQGDQPEVATPEPENDTDGTPFVDISELLADQEGEDGGDEGVETEGADSGAGDEETDWRQAYADLESQYAQLHNDRVAAQQFITQAQIGAVRQTFDQQQQAEWSAAEQYAATLNHQDATRYLGAVREKQVNDRSGFEGRLAQAVQQQQRVVEERSMVNAWMDELQRRFNLTNDQKAKLATVGDPRQMEYWAGVLSNQRKRKAQEKRSQEASKRRERGVDAVVVGGRTVPRRVRADSPEHLMALAGDLLF